MWMRVVAAAMATASFASITHAADPPEEDLRLLEVVLDQTLLSEAVAAYAGPSGGTLLPLRTVSELVGVAVTANPAEGVATGFILDERRSFHLDLGRGQVTISGKTASFSADLVRAYSDDIYVDSSLLSEWYPIGFDVDLFALRLELRPREPLPLQTRLERERRIRLWRLRRRPPRANFDRLTVPYSLWEVPFVDQRLQISLGERSRTNYSTYATGDLLFMSSEAYLTGGDEELVDTARLTLRRRDPDANILGWLGATEVAVGHVIHPASSLLSNTSDPLPGVFLTNRPLHRAAEFDRHAFRGNLPQGWDVELYHNDILIEYQQSGPEGEYFFPDVPILLGANFFRLVFYGPQGQRREEEHRFILGDSLSLPGHLDYRVAFNVESASKRRGSAAVSYGMSRYVTASAEVASLPIDLGERQYAKVGLRAFRGALFTYGDYVQDDTGGRAWEAGMQTRVLGVNVSLNHQELAGGYASEAFRGTTTSLAGRDLVRLDTAIPAWILPRIPVSLEVERQEFTSGGSRIVGRNRISTHYKGLSISNRASWSSSEGDSSPLEGSLQLSRSIRRVRVRGEILYTVAPTALAAANVILERSLGGGYRMFTSISHSLRGDDDHVYSVGFDKTTGSFAAGLNATTDADGRMGGNVDLSVGLGHEPREGTWDADARSRARSGAASVRVFLDQNENGRFDAGDQPLPGVGLTVNGVARTERSGPSGVVFLPELTPQVPADLALDTRTLEDPQWVPVLAGVQTMPRSGKTAMIDVPVVATAEIEGTVQAMRGGKLQGAGGATVELRDAGGKLVQQTTTAYDGFYVLTHVRRGAYHVGVLQQSATVVVSQREGTLEKPVTVTLARPVLTGIDFVVPGPGTDDGPFAGAVAEPVRADAPPVAPLDRRAAAPPQSPTAAGSVDERRYVVQLGTYSIEANAQRQAAAARSVVADVTVIRTGAHTVVRTGPRRHPEAIALARELTRRGMDAIVIARQPGRPHSPTAAADFVVQLGAFRSSSNARDLARRILESGGSWRPSIEQRGGLYFVQTAPFATRALADAARESLLRLGLTAIVRQRSE